MRKMIFAATIIVVISMFAGYNVYQAKNKVIISELSMANVEALAYESQDIDIICGKSQGRCWFTDKKLAGPFLPWYVTYCNPFSGRQSEYCTPGIPT